MSWRRVILGANGSVFRVSEITTGHRRMAAMSGHVVPVPWPAQTLPRAVCGHYARDGGAGSRLKDSGEN